MKDEGAQEGKRHRKTPHANSETVHIEERVSSRTEYSVNHYCIDAAADHVNRKYVEHSMEKFSGFSC